MGHPTAILRLSFLLFLMLDSCRLGVFSNSRVTLITVTPANPTSIVGATQQFLAHVTHKDGITIQTTAVTWSTSNPTVASISSSGTARGVNPGTVAIVATLDGVSGSTVLTVTASTPHTVSVTGGPGKLELAFPGNAQHFVYVANALEDVISIYRLGARASEEEAIHDVSVSPGRGPVWMAVHPLGKFLYVVNRTSENISAFSIDAATGRLQPVVGSPFECGNKPWAIAVDAVGESVEVTHFGSPEVTRYRVDPSTGSLTLLQPQ